MKTVYHQKITREALSEYFSPAALEAVVAANIGQDALRYQVGHDHFHYDNNSFAVADAYVESLRQNAWAALKSGQPVLAREEFGRLTHAVQDFYAHSNYVALWLDAHGPDDPQRIDPLDEKLRQHPGLHSGKLYYPLEALSFIPALAPFVLPYLPHDSHAHMNKDHPGRPQFEAAYHAAIKRTRHEYERFTAGLEPGALLSFTGKG